MNATFAVAANPHRLRGLSSLTLMLLSNSLICGNISLIPREDSLL
jgi:hypothetical protein